MIQLLLGVADAWAAETAHVQKVNTSATDVLTPSVQPAPTKNSNKQQPVTRPVYRPKQQKVIAIDFGIDEENLEAGKTQLPEFQLGVAPSVQRKLAEKKKNRPAITKPGTPEEQLKSHDEFGTASDGKYNQDLASSALKESQKPVNLKKALKELKRNSTRDLEADYD